MRTVVELFGGPGDGGTAIVTGRPYPSTIDIDGVKYWLWVECEHGQASYRVSGWRAARQS